jgi:hypothetical protein
VAIVPKKVATTQASIRRRSCGSQYRLEFSLFVRTDWGSLYHRATDTFRASGTGPSEPLLPAGVVPLIPWSEGVGHLTFLNGVITDFVVSGPLLEF